MFDVIITYENGDKDVLFLQTEKTYGYKVDTNIPSNLTSSNKLPVGTYYFKLYCEDYEGNGTKIKKSYSETYTIVVNKTVVDCVNYGWGAHIIDNTKAVMSLRILDMTSSEKPIFLIRDNMEAFGITSFAYVNNETYKCEVIEPGTYLARVEYALNEECFEYINFPPHECRYTWDGTMITNITPIY